MSKEQYGFVHIPRTAGGSLVNALVQSDWIILGHDEPSPHYMHISDFRVHHPQKDAFLIATVRNPYDRLVSAFHYLKAGGDNEADQRDAELYLSKYTDFESFVMNGFNFWSRRRMLKQIHLKPQAFWISHKRKLLTNQLFKFEELDKLFEFVSKHSSITSEEIGHVHASNRSKYEDYYSNKMKKVVQNIYAVDFEFGNYKR